MILLSGLTYVREIAPSHTESSLRPMTAFVTPDTGPAASVPGPHITQRKLFIAFVGLSPEKEHAPETFVPDEGRAVPRLRALARPLRPGAA